MRLSKGVAFLIQNMFLNGFTRVLPQEAIAFWNRWLWYYHAALAIGTLHKRTTESCVCYVALHRGHAIFFPCVLTLSLGVVHTAGEEDRIHGYQLSSVRPGLYRDSSHQITAVVVTCSCAVHLSMAYRPVLQHEALRVWRRWPHWCNYAAITSVSSRLLQPCCLCKLCIRKMSGLPYRDHR